MFIDTTDHHQEYNFLRPKQREKNKWINLKVSLTNKDVCKQETNK